MIRWFYSAPLLLISVVVLALGQHQDGATPTTPNQAGGAQSQSQAITPIPFGESNGEVVYNASGVVPLADARFLFCDNNVNDALFELDLAVDGAKRGPLIKRPLQGLAADAIDDMEAMTFAEEKGRRFVFVTSSLCAKKTKDGQSLRVPPSGLLRVIVKPDGSLAAENLPGFRDWFIQNTPAIAESAKLIPDEGGLNIEGLAWDRSRHALLFGVRTSLAANKALVVPVRVKKLSDPWTTSNLEMLPPIWLTLEAAEAAQGIRGLEYIPSRHAFWVITGKAISQTKVPFVLYEWSGDQQGTLHRLNLTFAEKMKPESVTTGTIAGMPVLVFVDDGGGYQVLWPGKTLL